MRFDRSLEASYGELVPLSPRIARLLAPNPGPFTFKGTGVYLVGAGDSLAVIDPGPALPEHLDALRRAIGARRVSHILITHSHRDHSPAAAPLKAWTGANIFAGFSSDDPLHAQGPGGGATTESHDPDFHPDILLRDGDIVAGDGFRFEAVATPGHATGHLCYALAEEKALFTGDHVMGWSTSVVAPPDGDMADYLASLEKLRRRDDAIFYPTHGSPIREPRPWLEDLIAHRQAREGQLLAAIARGTGTVAALTAKLYPDIDPALAGAAAAQIQAHIDLLLRKGAIAFDGTGYRKL